MIGEKLPLRSLTPTHGFLSGIAFHEKVPLNTSRNLRAYTASRSENCLLIPSLNNS